MKKLILSLGFAVLASGAFSQIIFTVEEPAGIAGAYTFEGTGTSWGMDLSIPGNNVLDTVVLMDDSLACTPPINNIAGKVALLYRGTCEFGAKALAAQDAGAVGVIIVNNIGGAPIPMGAGAVGASVTIPVVMISDVDGALIRNAMETEDVIVFIGNKTGYFNDDIGFQATNVMRADYGGVPQTVAENGTEFSIKPHAWVFNYGLNDQTGMTLTVTISGTPYNEVVNIPSILSGDSVEINTLPVYAPASWSVGAHTLTYTLAYGTTDEYPSDNELSSTFEITSEILSLARLTDGLPTSDGGTKSGDAEEEFTTCIVYRDANADRLGVDGMYFSASTLATDELTGFDVIVTAYEWNDAFTDLDDPNIAVTLLNPIASGTYSFTGDYQDSVVYAQFDQQAVLENDQRYLFCVTDNTMLIYIGYDSKTKYAANEEANNQPLYPILSDATWYLGGFSGSPVPAIGVKTFPAENLTINENVLEASAFPNPSKDVVTVKINGEGDATLKITDLSGRLVSTQDVKINGGQFTTTVAGMNAGNYVFTLDMSNGTTSRFNVVVAK
jgi:hypothetical protein